MNGEDRCRTRTILVLAALRTKYEYIPDQAGRMPWTWRSHLARRVAAGGRARSFQRHEAGRIVAGPVASGGWSSKESLERSLAKLAKPVTPSVGRGEAEGAQLGKMCRRSVSLWGADWRVELPVRPNAAVQLARGRRGSGLG
ncbi:hypothetical protein ACCO45_009727 [Purpureocillium lilacinum]|uniref:Uncharacterized protein n=1 Tax=Purpureocillium lilacinum TaxID=33203 RepID=A0ACC4DKG5_PURLI